MIVPFSQPQCIDRKHFQDVFHTPTTLQLMSTILLCICGSLEYNNSFRKTLPWKLLSPYVLPPALGCFSLYVHMPRERRLCCKNFVLKYFHGLSTLRKIFNTKIFPTKISYNKTFSIYGIFRSSSFAFSLVRSHV